MITRTRRDILIAAAATTFVAGCATHEDARVTPVGRHDVDFVKRGTGSPPVILMHGLGDDMTTWRSTLDPLAALSTIYAYNRPGYGNSGWTSAARDSEAVVGELRGFLDAQKIGRPVVLVGHSLGGIYAQYFARAFPAEVAGLVLVDTTVPRQTTLLKTVAPAQFSAISLLMGRQPPLVRREFQAVQMAEGQVSALPPYHGPVVMLVAQRSDALSPPAFTQGRKALMDALAADYGAQVRTVNTGHFIQKENPEAVVSAVATVLQTIRSR